MKLFLSRLLLTAFSLKALAGHFFPSQMLVKTPFATFSPTVCLLKEPFFFTPLLTIRLLKLFHHFLSHFTWSPELLLSPLLPIIWPLKSYFITSFSLIMCLLPIGQWSCHLFCPSGPSYPICHLLPAQDLDS